MSRSLFAASALVVLLAVPATAQENQRPTFLLRVQPIDEMVKTVEYVANLIEQEEEAKQFLGFIDSLKGDKGLMGIDTKRPMGLSITVSTAGFEDTSGAIFVPVADEEEFLDLFARVSALAGLEEPIEPKKGDDGVYVIEHAELPMPVYFRFAQQYACFTVMDKAAIDPKNLPDVKKLLAMEDGNLLSVSAFLDQLPDELTDLALGQLELMLAEAKEERDPGDTELEHQMKVKFVDSFVGGLKMVLEEGGEVRLGLAVDPKKDEFRLEFDMGAQKDTPLAKRFAALGARKSVLAGLLKPGDAFATSMNFEFPEAMKEAFGPAIEEGFKMAREEAAVDIPIDVKHVEKLLDAVKPTVKAGVIDAAFAIQGPNTAGMYVMVGGARVVKGTDIEAAIKDVVGELPGEIRDLVTFDVAKVGSATLHKVTLPPEAGQDAEFRKMIGEKAEVWIATAEDRVLVVLGEDGKDVITAALKAPEGPAPMFGFQLGFKAMAPLMEDENPGATELARTVFKDIKPGDDTFSFTIDGGDKLRVRLGMKGLALKFAIKQDELKQDELKDELKEAEKPDID